LTARAKAVAGISRFTLDLILDSDARREAVFFAVPIYPTNARPRSRPPFRVCAKKTSRLRAEAAEFYGDLRSILLLLRADHDADPPVRFGHYLDPFQLYRAILVNVRADIDYRANAGAAAEFRAETSSLARDLARASWCY
jgi:hypothetical protein